ncbi:ATP-binding cassette domain-containing protein [Helicobacter salomonis]|uniref:ATP-binding cassette domain-containing protein n=1 Tax=Helicobacter salomonis TaxID=56878 RepID=UPI0018F825C3|nr:ATP-binding cassette domain-containing protein [Helicobacter salomonis]
MQHLNIKIKIAKEKHPLIDVEFNLEKGEITAMLGKSGSGKSLSAASIFGFSPAGFECSTEVKLGNTPYSKRHLSMIMQNPRTAFNVLMTLKAHAIESLKVIDKWDASGMDRIEKALEEVCLEPSVLDKYPFELSGGMLQRAMIALALLKEPEFIIADEPTTDLDLITQSKILELLLELKTKKRVGFLLITHDFGVVKRIADSVLVVSEGRIVQRGSVQEIFENPIHPQTKLLIEAYKNFGRGWHASA